MGSVERCWMCDLPLSKRRIVSDDGKGPARHYPDCETWHRQAAALIFGPGNDDMLVRDVRDLIDQIGDDDRPQDRLAAAIRSDAPERWAAEREGSR